MGTNYYHRYNHCDCCGRYDERHICKSLNKFRGYRPDPAWPEEFTGPEIVSWRQWREVLRTEGEIWDEYGRRIDLENFIADVEAVEPASRRRQYEWVMAHGLDPRRGERDWLDPDGFSFYDGEFS